MPSAPLSDHNFIPTSTENRKRVFFRRGAYTPQEIANREAYYREYHRRLATAQSLSPTRRSFRLTYRQTY